MVPAPDRKARGWEPLLSLLCVLGEQRQLAEDTCLMMERPGPFFSGVMASVWQGAGKRRQHVFCLGD